MSKLQEAIDAYLAAQNGKPIVVRDMCLAIWNAAMQRAAEVCREDESGRDGGGYFADIIEQEQEK